MQYFLTHVLVLYPTGIAWGLVALCPNLARKNGNILTYLLTYSIHDEFRTCMDERGRYASAFYPSWSQLPGSLLQPLTSLYGRPM